MFDVTQALRDPGRPYPFRVEQTIAPQDVMGQTVAFDPALVAGHVIATPEGDIMVEGTMSVTAHAPCAYCLEPANTMLQAVFSETFLRDGDPEDDEVFTYTSSSLSFEKLVLSYALLELPMRLICGEECKGVPELGDGQSPIKWEADVAASQKDQQNAHPFAALQQLLTKDEEV